MALVLYTDVAEIAFDFEHELGDPEAIAASIEARLTFQDSDLAPAAVPSTASVPHPFSSFPFSWTTSFFHSFLDF